MEVATGSVRALRDLLNSRIGFCIGEERLGDLSETAEARIKAIGLSDLSEYVDLLEGESEDKGEWQSFLNEILIPETSFFRNKELFEALRDELLPEAAKIRPPRIWVSACSSGEEVYSVAIALLESGSRTLDTVQPIMATDISQRVLSFAKRGRYRKRSLERLDSELVRRYFDETEDYFTVNERLRSLVTFRHHNLAAPRTPDFLDDQWDFIFCRNVTIYFKPELVRQILGRMADMLRPGGIMVAGHSENVSMMEPRLRPVRARGLFVYRKEAPASSCRRPHVSTSAAPSTKLSDRGGPVARPRVRPPQSPAPAAKPEAAAQVFLEEAWELCRLQRYAEAKMKAEKALSVDPGLHCAEVLKAYVLIHTGASDEAATICQAVIDKNPLLAEAYYVKGLLECGKEDPSGSIELFRCSLALQPDFVMAYFHLSNVYRQMGLQKQSLAWIKRTLGVLETAGDSQLDRWGEGFSVELMRATCEKALELGGQGGTAR